MSDELEAVLSHLRVKQRRGDRAECICPAHPDRQASLSVSAGTEQPVVLHCHAGCTVEAILTAMGLSWADVTGKGSPHPVVTYEYTDRVGKALYAVERWVGLEGRSKSFRPRLADGRYQRPQPAEEVLYRLAEVLAAKETGRAVHVVEGEKDADTAAEFGMVATTAMSGATQAWLPQFSEALAGADVVVVADMDDPGRARARRVGESVRPYARTVRLAQPRWGKDLSEHLLAGFGPDLLDPLPQATSLVAYSLLDVQARSIDWAWTGWLPRNMLSLIEGDPGDGKSMLTLDLAARWTTGRPMPDGSPNPFGGPVRVGMASAEDDVARVIKPRFMQAGGDPANLQFVEGMPGIGRYTRTLDLETDGDAIRQAIIDLGLAVFILDPLMAYLGSTRTAVDNEVRKVLGPLRLIAEETSCTIGAVRHLRKAGGKAVHAGGGSIAFTGQARAVLLVGRNPSDNDQRIVAVVKSNLAASPPNQGYRVAADPVTGVPVVMWEGAVTDVDVSEIIGQVGAGSEARAEVTARVVELLSVEELAFQPLHRKLLQSGVECGEKLLRSVLKAVAVQVRLHAGTSAQAYLYRLKSAEGTVPPVDGAVPADGGWLADEPTSPTTKTSPTTANHPADSVQPLPSTPGGGAEEGWLAEDGLVFGLAPDAHVANHPPAAPQDDDLVVACQVCGGIDRLTRHDTGAGVPPAGAWRCHAHHPARWAPGAPA